MDNKKFLIAIDGSYMMYTIIFGSVKDFTEQYPADAAYFIKPIEECDQNNLPDLLNCDNYKKVLKKYVLKRLEEIDQIARDNFQDEINECQDIDIVFAMDDRLKNSFRKDLYPEYKAQRALVKRQYQIQPIKDYIVNVLFKELDVENSCNYRIIKIDGAECDDVIAVLAKDISPRYSKTLIIASDHDFLQLENVTQYNMFGKEVVRDLGGEIVNAKDYLLGKILMGDKSDNIKSVFNRCGPKTALKLVKDKNALKTMLKESQDANERYQLNKKLISFTSLPDELSKSISKRLNEALYKEEVLNKAKKNDWSRFMDL